MFWLRRYRDDRSPYRRVRAHAIRTQLDAVIALALQLALRRHEIRSLSVDDAHYDNATILVGEWETQSFRVVPFTPGANACLEAWITSRHFLSPHTRTMWLNTHAGPTAHLPMSDGVFNRLLHTYVGPGWELRRLRDTCAAGWVRAGMSLEHLRQLLGLSRIEDTLPYARLVGGSLEGRMAQLDDLFSELVAA